MNSNDRFHPGMSTLATGFCAVVSLGLVLLGIAVSIGVFKGELDPNRKREESQLDKDKELLRSYTLSSFLTPFSNANSKSDSAKSSVPPPEDQ